jgi:hypothetical protein
VVATEWEFVFVLPNLVLATASNERHSGDWPMGISFGDELITIVSSDNPHVAHLRSDKTIEQILTSFVDEYGKPYSPAILLTHRSAPETVRINLAAIVAFRNAIALAFILRARAAAERGYGGLDPTWSDTFDFHPAQIGGTGGMILHSPALLSVVSSGAKLRLTRSPYIPLTDGRLHPDSYLFRSFEKAWIKRYCGKAETEKFGDRLFRSLDVAYQACAVGTKCEGSLNEYGIQVALWVSAIEILAWPNKRHADLESVLLLLNRDSIDERDRKLRYRIKIKNPKTRKPEIRRVSALQRAYVYLYRARNQFLHGNPVRENSLLTLNRTERVGLPRLAAVVYRAALVAYLDPKYPKQIKNLEELRTRVEESFEDNTYGEALAELFGYTR